MKEAGKQIPHPQKARARDDKALVLAMMKSFELKQESVWH